MSEHSNSYDIALIKQIAASRSNVVDRVTQVLCPGAPLVEPIRKISRGLLRKMVSYGEISCPSCGPTCSDQGCPLAD